MKSYTYLIVGGGMTAAAAIEGIREADPEGSIGVVAQEPHAPYNRPPLTKGLWKGEALDSIWRDVDGKGVTLHLGRTVRSLDPVGRQATDDQGTVFQFEKLLLATGAAPRRLPFGGEQVLYFRTLDDYQRLRGLVEQHQRFLVIGGGFIGSELAAALAMNGRQVVMAFPGEGLGGRVFPPDLSRFLNDYYRGKGVEVVAGASAVGLETRQGQSVVTLRSAEGEREVTADAVVAGIGVEPDVALAREAGLAVDNGIRVNAALQTSHPDIYAAGDVASFHNPALDQWLRVEHEDNANTMGRAAGLSMAGQPVAYDHLPFFYSDLFELGYEAVGEVDARLETVVDWKVPHQEGVVYYLRSGRVRGVLLWNVWEQVDAARQLIAEPGPFEAADLRGRLPA
jgi:NADPH-dependent 2,4-dienoyl-CoA reductase/sulfur reductase-like enzyme